MIFWFNFIKIYRNVKKKLYQKEQRIEQIFASFSILAIFIVSLGLFGLASFTAEQRTKEIGIRKVLGASAGKIVLMLSKEYVKLIAVAALVAWPVTYYFMNVWLQNFAYRISVGMSSFFYSAVIGLFITLLSMSFQTIKATLANPVESLRHE